MKKQVLTTVALLSLLVTLAMSSFANAGRIMVNIPFAFTAGKALLPAGQYTLEQAGVINNSLLIRSADGKAKAAYVTTMSNDTMRRAESKAKLVFHRYGDTYFLSQIWEAGSSIVHEVPKTAAERELLKQGRNHLAENATEPEIITVTAQ
jgi:hypothetical protein